MSVTELYPQALMEDLAKSGLVPADLKVRSAGPTEKQATNTPMGVDAYVIPYFDMYGKPIQFYRLKLLNSPDPDVRYKQLASSGNHVYFPPGFNDLLPKARYIIITEGEKKAAAAVKAGFPCVGLGGVESWRNRTIKLHKDAVIGESKTGNVVVKMPAGAEVSEETDSLAIGIKEVIQLARQKGIPILIIFDSDLGVKGLVRFEVQRAAAALGFELRHRGIKFPHIRQVVLRPDERMDGKLGLDDYLVNEDLGPDMLEQLIHDNLLQRTAFPKHPNVREYVNKKLQKAAITRTEMAGLSTAIVCDLDTNGIRLYCADDDNMYYFDESTHKLLRVHFTQYMDFAKTDFARKLYDAYGITQADQRLLQVLNSQFCGEEPIQQVRPEKIMTVRGDTFYYQISDGRMVKVDATGIRIMLNGSDNVLFEGNSVEEINHGELSKALEEVSKKPLQNIWYEILKEARIAPSHEDRARKLLSYLYSISPWFYRWRATQLPLEQMLGEAGAGKSTMYKIRQLQICGRSYLRNAPKDLKDWTASVASSGSLHVTDNVHMTGGMLKQQLSDELAQPLDTPIMTPTGWSTMGDLHVGDTVLDPWGRSVKIVQEHPHGTKSVYRVVFSNGNSTECCMDHKWFVQTRDHMKKGPTHGRVMSLEDIQKSGLRYKGSIGRARWFVPSLFNRQIDMTRSDLNYNAHLVISSYNMGLLLGDGHLNSKQTFIASGDRDAIERFERELPEGTTLGSSKAYSYYVRGTGAKLVKRALQDLGLKGTLARTKFIPEEYLYTTAEMRLNLLQGLMDSDGTVHVNHAIYSTLSRRLAEGVKFLVQSLGGRSSIFERSDSAYQVSVSLPDNLNPFWANRKSSRYNENCTKNKHCNKSIIAIEYVGEKEVKCISLETQAGLYLTNDFIITHNCRVITEDEPFIEARKLYTDNDLVKVPVRSVFAVTAIKQPFTNTDIIQRSIIAQLDKGTEHIEYDANWVDTQISRHGGRIGMVAHQLVFMHRMFAHIKKSWNPTYRARFRLINVEQLLIKTAEVLGEDPSWIADWLEKSRDQMTMETDSALEGLTVWAEKVRKRARESKTPLKSLEFIAREMSDWFAAEEEWEGNTVLISARKIGHYIEEKKNTVAQIAGIEPTGRKRNNNKTYKVIELPDD